MATATETIDSYKTEDGRLSLVQVTTGYNESGRVSMDKVQTPHELRLELRLSGDKVDEFPIPVCQAETDYLFNRLQMAFRYHKEIGSPSAAVVSELWRVHDAPASDGIYGGFRFVDLEVSDSSDLNAPDEYDGFQIVNIQQGL